MTDNNILLANTYYYNKYLTENNDNDNNNISKAKLQFINQDSMFTNIIDINNLDIITDYDENRLKNIPISLNDYYQKYPVIDLNDKIILNNIYNIYNIKDLIHWLKNNSNKNIKTINRILDISWFFFNKEIYYNLDFFKDYYVKLYSNNINDLSKEDLEYIIENIFKNYNIKKDKEISKIIFSKLSSFFSK